MKKIILTVLSVAFCMLQETNAQGKVCLKGNNSNISYVGRTEIQGDGSVSFDWTGTYLRTMLSGGELSIRLSDTGINYYNVFVDSLLHKVDRKSTRLNSSH